MKNFVFQAWENSRSFREWLVRQHFYAARDVWGVGLEFPELSFPYMLMGIITIVISAFAFLVTTLILSYEETWWKLIPAYIVVAMCSYIMFWVFYAILKLVVPRIISQAHNFAFRTEKAKNDDEQTEDYIL